MLSMKWVWAVAISLLLSACGGSSYDENNALNSVSTKPDFLLDVSVAANPVIADGNLLYEITVSNVSAMPVNEVVVQFQVPAALQFHGTTDAEPNTTCETCVDGDEASWVLGTLINGESRTIVLNTTILSGTQVGSLISASFRATSPDVSENVNVIKTVEVYNNSVSQLTMRASKNSVMPGESLSYQFDMGNIDVNSLSNLELRVTLPAGVTVSVNSISDGGSQDGTSGEIVWKMDSLAVGDTIRREVNIMVDTAAFAGQILVARAELRHDGGIELDVSAEQVVTVVITPFLLTVDISTLPDPVAADGRLLYEITVSNVSAMPVNEVVVQFRVPAALQFHGTTDAEPNTTCEACVDGDETSWMLGTLTKGESRTIALNATVLPSVLAGSLISASFQVTSPDVSNNISYKAVTQVSTVELVKTTNPNFKAIKLVEDVKGVVVISWFGFNYFTSNYELKSRSIVAFNDGNFSKDLNTIATRGVDFSKINNPEKWGKYRISNGKFEISNGNDEDFKTMDYYTLYEALPKNERVVGCWSITNTFSFSDGIATSSGMSINGWCFDDNGRFSKNHTFGFSGSTGNSPYGNALNLPILQNSSFSESGELGWYQIDGNMVQLIYDNGKKEIKFIGIDDLLLLGTGWYVTI